MKILSVAYPFAPVRADTAGGAEQVLAMLDRGLCEAGHQSRVIARAGSEISGELVAIPTEADQLDTAHQAHVRGLVSAAIASATESFRPDLIHMHGIDFDQYLPAPGPPVLATLHLPPAWYDPRVFAIARPQTWLHCVSQSQQDSCPAASNLLAYIPNGVPEDLIRMDVKKCDFAVALGRICPEKGFHLAFDAAQAANVPLLLAGQVYAYDAHVRYYTDEILPRCEARLRFIGAAGLRAKRRLLSSARCVLIPSLAPETSSLVAMEAAMCGTPAIAFRAGALPEVIEEGVTGFIVDDVDAMVRAIARCCLIDPIQCRKRALSRFSARRAFERYLQLYEQLIHA